MKALVKSTTKPAEVLTPADPEFNTLRGYLSAEKGSVLQAVAYMALGGFEIERLRKKYEVKRGGDRKSKSNPHGAGLISWPARLKQETGLSEDTAARRVAVAKSVKARSTALRDCTAMLESTPFSQLPEADQARVIAATKNACDGETAKSLIQEHGAARKDKGKNLATQRHKGGNSTEAVSTPEEDAQNALGPFLRTALGLRHDFPAKFKRHLFSLPLEREEGKTLKEQVSATELLAELEGWYREAKEAVAIMSKAAHASRIKDPKARQADVTAKLLAALPEDAEAAA